MATLPPWLQINPEQFTQAAIAGGQQGYQAAAEAGSLAQRGLISAVQLAQESAAKAAEIAVRREQINAELAQNAARVSAARAEAAAQNSIRQQQVDLARIAEENERVNEAARIQSAMDINAANIQGEKDVAGIRANAPKGFAPSELGRMAAEMNALPEGDPMRAVYMARMNKLSEQAQKPVKLNTTDAAELASAKKELQSIFGKYQSGEVPSFDQETLAKRTALQKRIQELEGRTNPVTPVATPALPVGGPLRYQLINGQYQLTQ